MFQTLKSWLTPARTAEPNPRRFAPQLEALADRLTPTVNLVSGHLIIHGTDANDWVSIAPSGTNYQVYENGVTRYIPRAAVTGDVLFKGFGGSDRFDNSTALRSIAYGGAGDDALFGGSNADTFYGEGGNDRLSR
jgi:Ca2+-binding RTX toxin-like protein